MQKAFLIEMKQTSSNARILVDGATLFTNSHFASYPVKDKKKKKSMIEKKVPGLMLARARFSGLSVTLLCGADSDVEGDNY